MKTLPPALAEDPHRLARFEREVKSVATLNHPNIVTIYSVEEADGKRFFTMEHVEGKTLSQSIPQGGLPLKEFLRIAVPLADALAAAHAKGIQHRDLKPGNVMVNATAGSRSSTSASPSSASTRRPRRWASIPRRR